MNTSNTEALLTERNKTHGDYQKQANVTQGLKLIVRMFQRENFRVISAEHQDALDMIFTKIGRIVAGDPNVKDHWDDIAGYATLGSRYVRPGSEVSPQIETTKQVCERPPEPKVSYPNYFPPKYYRQASCERPPGDGGVGQPHGGSF